MGNTSTRRRKTGRPTGLQGVSGGRPRGRYRFSDGFIRVATAVLLITVGEAMSNGAVFLIVGGFVLPLLIAAILGGEAIAPGAGLLGFGLIAGLALFALMQAEYFRDLVGPWAPGALWGGLALMIMSGIGFWLVGRAAKVPMWLQAPVPGSPRVYVQGESEHP